MFVAIKFLVELLIGALARVGESSVKGERETVQDVMGQAMKQQRTTPILINNP